MGRVTLPEVGDGSSDPPRGMEWAGRPSERSETGWGTLQDD